MNERLPPAEQLDCHSIAYMESVLADAQQRKGEIPPVWMGYAASPNGDGSTPPDKASLPTRYAAATASKSKSSAPRFVSQERLDRLVWAFRAWGHLAARLDPLGLRAVGESFWENLHPTAQLAELSLELHGLTAADLDKQFSSPLRNEPVLQSLREIIKELRGLYCGAIGYQFMYVQDLEIRDWFLDRIEGSAAQPTDNRPRHRRILEQLVRADAFEQFVRKKFPGAKVFSIDGSESLIPLLDMILCHAAEQEVREVVLGMAHRGRLNVLTNLFNKPPESLFRSFADRLPQGPKGHGDVRYHLGDEARWVSDSGRELQLSMCFNPSHLEYVNPVAMGRVRAMQDAHRDERRRRSLAILIHGDAAFAAEGIVYETLNLGRLPAYDTGGVVHVVINNQIGFTTTPAENRAGAYATDVARAVQLPVLHVNGEDLEAVARAARLAMDFRARFGRDIILDLVGFRRWGHNETDEPSFTQPRLYSAIEKHERVRNRYVAALVEAQEIKTTEVEQIDQQYLDYLREQYDAAMAAEKPSTTGGADFPAAPLPRRGEYFGGPEPVEEPQTGLPRPQLVKLLHKLTKTPQDFHVHPKLQRSLEERRKMAAGEESIDWATAEALALASLCVEGHPLRLAGQDTQRGTFSHRHAVLHDSVDGRVHPLFAHLDPHQARVEIINSPLNEAATMGFEYGYSLEAPQALVAWEAQFGDFVNVAQVIIDQFLASAEDKWDQLNGLVLLLPHGFEGQGPEHSSARLERFLTLAAEDNLQIVQPSTPAQYFHVLRRQVKRKWCKPLVVFTPKSLLRLRQARSPLSDFEQGTFQRVMGDPSVENAARVLLCSGKVYYELLAYREEHQRSDVGIVRVEQYYPLHDRFLTKALQPYADGTPVCWVQEEPENMGAWRYWRAIYGDELLGRFPLSVAARAASASPATGAKYIHRQEQQTLLQQAFGENAPAPLELTAKEIAS